MADWKIRRRHGECSRCEAAFEDGQRLASLLRIDEEDDVLREDVCEACWKAGDPDSYLFWWFTRHHPTRSKTVQLDLGSLERLFMELGSREEGSLRELRYLLCLLLMRKRKLKLIRVLRGKDGERLILRRPRRQEEIEVHVFDFTTERLEELRSRLQEVLDGAGPLAGDELPGGESDEEGAEPSEAEPTTDDEAALDGDALDGAAPSLADELTAVVDGIDGEPEPPQGSSGPDSEAAATDGLDPSDAETEPTPAS